LLSETINYNIQENKGKLKKINYLLAQEKSTLLIGEDPILGEVIGKSIKDAQQIIDLHLHDAANLYNEANNKLADFKGKTPLTRWKNELAEYRQQLTQTEIRLHTIDPDISKLQSQLTKIKEQLAATPQLLTLKREVVSDPVVTIMADETDLNGLSLQNEMLNPAYSALIDQRDKTQVALVKLLAEKSALQKEKDGLITEINKLRKAVADAENEFASLLINVVITQKLYSKIKSIALAYRNQKSELKMEPNNKIYQSLKSSAIAQEIGLAELQIKYSNLKDQIKYNDNRISRLKQRIATAETDKDYLLRELDRTREAYWALKQKQTDLGIEIASMQNSMAQIIIPAYPASKPVAPRKVFIVAVATVLGFIIGVFWIFIMAAVEEPKPEPKIKIQ